MRLVFDPKPVKTFSFQISFNIGWRHEPPKEKGLLRKELERLLNIILSIMPSWFDGFYHLDAEFSSVTIMGLCEDHKYLVKVLQVIENEFPERFVELKAGLELATLSGGIEKSTVNVIREFHTIHTGGRPKVHAIPKRFLNLKDLTRVHKHFLASVMLKAGNEFFLEVSPRGDRIQYGMKMRNLIIENIELALKSYEHWIRRRCESTKETTSILTLMNVFEKKSRNVDDIIKEIYTINIVALKEALEKFKNIKNKMRVDVYEQRTSESNFS